jgi:SAM-dependent methyltransferase
MSSQSINEWERVEIARSAAEASQIDVTKLVADDTELQRYLDPSPHTCYPLEYSFYLLGDVRGKTVLEYGCGDGINTLALARRGAMVNALDISPELIGVARQRLAANQITGGVAFIVGSAHDLPFPDESTDLVFGMAILHHLDLALSAAEVRRVLRSGGRAIFHEPVRNSSLLTFVRRCVPYRAADVSPFERPLTDQELATYAQGFSAVRSKAFILPTTRLIDHLPPLRKLLLKTCYRMDAALLRRIPALAHYATVRVIELTK